MSGTEERRDLLRLIYENVTDAEDGSATGFVGNLSPIDVLKIVMPEALGPGGCQALYDAIQDDPQPPHIYTGPLSGRVYVAVRYHKEGDLFVSDEKHDITDALSAHLRSLP